MTSKPIKRWTNYSAWDALPVLLTVEDVCAVMKISETTALKMLNNGDIPGVKIAGQWRISKNDLRATVEQIQPEQPQIETLCGIVAELLEEVRQLKTQKAG